MSAPACEYFIASGFVCELALSHILHLLNQPRSFLECRFCSLQIQLSTPPWTYVFFLHVTHEQPPPNLLLSCLSSDVFKEQNDGPPGFAVWVPTQPPQVFFSPPYIPSIAAAREANRLK